MSYEAWGEPDGRPWPTALPVNAARCCPSACKQVADCWRANQPKRIPVGVVGIITLDASKLVKPGAWCSMFVDRRWKPNPAGNPAQTEIK